MNHASTSGGDKPLIVQFDDNRLLTSLFGRHDEFLARIEKHLGVSLSSRGNRVAIVGSGRSATAASRALNDLYGRLKRGQVVDAGEVDAAVRMAVHEVGIGEGSDGVDRGRVTIQTRKRLITARSAAQAAYIRALESYELVFAQGPAGTGKTYLAVAVAVAMMLRGQVDRIILSRPAVEAGERLGFLPGDVREKVDPYLRPLYDALHDMLPADVVARKLENGEIEIAPLAFMRGRTLSNAFVILDEAQNCTVGQMKMFLTRLGENSRMVVTGDISQVDLPPGVLSGMIDALSVLDGMEGTAAITFTDADVVRHPLVTQIVRAYDAREKASAAAKRADERSP
ncbi:MAG: PhoH family protein [Alphaproteobacteria bacterium]